MKILLIFSIFFMLCCRFQVESGIGIEQHDSTKQCSSHCCSHQLGPMAKGETKKIEGACEIAECLDNRDVKFSICAPVHAEYPCRVLKGDVSKPFPACCYEIKCD